MADDDTSTFVPAPHVPQIDLRRIAKITTYEVMDTDLDAIQKTSDEEQLAFGFATAAIGALAGALSSWPATGNPTTVQLVITIISAVFALWYGLTWWFRRKHKKQFLARIREEKAKSPTTALSATSQGSPQITG